MKTNRILHIVILLLINTLTNAQDYTWTRMYGTLNGNCIDPENLYNQSGYNSNRALELDSKGNAYILGTGSYSLHFDPNEQDTTGTFPFGNMSVFLSKYNCEGDNEWSLLISQAGSFASGQALQIVNDTIYISCNYSIESAYSNFYFLDTVVNIRPDQTLNYPFTKGNSFSIWASISPTGEVIEKHLFYAGLCSFTEDPYLNVSAGACIEKTRISQDYRYFLLRQQSYISYFYQYDPKQLFLDNVAFGDSIYYTDTCIGNHLYNNYRLCKFDKNMSFVKENVLIDSVDMDGLYPIYTTNFFDMIKDKHDNLYISGQFDIGGIDTTATKCKIYIDGHCINLFNNIDTTGNAFPYQSLQVSFIIKLNANLECEWIKQTYYRGDLEIWGEEENISGYTIGHFLRLALNETEDTLFFNGDGGYYFPDKDDNTALVFPDGTVFTRDTLSGGAFLAALKADDGDFLWYKSDFYGRPITVGALTCHNGEIYNTIRWKNNLTLSDTVYYTPYSGMFGSSIVVTNSLGEYKRSYNLNSNAVAKLFLVMIPFGTMVYLSLAMVKIALFTARYTILFVQRMSIF